MRILCFLGLVVISAGCAHTGDGIIRQKSVYSAEETVLRLQTVLNEKGLTIFETVDHAAGAAKVGQSLPSTTLVIFGNPKAGTPLMKCAREVALDLPQKALVYEDTDGTVWLIYNDPAYLAKRHRLPGCEKPLLNIGNALAGLTKTATNAQPQ
ncbi:MAG: DUF302 domain-containing protein [Woeseiaceae bacterium]